MLFLLLVSAVWVETDTYRVVALILVLWGLYEFLTFGFRAWIGWMGFACLGWATYVAIRFVGVYTSGTAQSLGTSEGIYLLPVFYMTVGYMMFQYRDLLGKTVLAFLVLSLAFLLATLDFLSIFDGKLHNFLMTNNTIHSSVSGGLIVLALINLATYAARTVTSDHKRWALEGLCYLGIALSFVGLYGAKSKGVWVALMVAFCVQFLFLARRTFLIDRPAKGAVLLVAFVAFIGAFAASNWAAIAPSYQNTGTALVEAVTTGHPLAAIRDAVDSKTAAPSTKTRLVLWHNAIEVWAHNPIFGSGIGWKDLFATAHYKNTGFDIVHNGYLEIAMRYGLVGLGFYAMLFGWALTMSRRAYARGLIPREAFAFHVVSMVFFLATITTNSNNRLAIGESLMLVSAAFGFFCLYLRQYADRPDAKSA